MSFDKTIRSIIINSSMFACAAISAFFVFYTIRLLYITHGLTVVRAGGGGTYIGAVVFPVLAVLFGVISWRLKKTAGKNN